MIPPNTPFCLLGSTQLVNAAKLIARMDQGHGLVDRILLATPLAFRPTLTEMEAATDQLYTKVVSDFCELFENINGIDENVEQLLAGVPSSQPDTMTSKTTLENAASFVNHLETQKEILCQVINRKHENFHFSLITFIAHTSTNLVGSLSAFYSPIEKDSAREALCTVVYSNIRESFT